MLYQSVSEWWRLVRLGLGAVIEWWYGPLIVERVATRDWQSLLLYGCELVADLTGTDRS
jgi:hypothetical protein